MATTMPARIATLDIVRGVAVMGILAMNIVAFAMPPAAYVNPLAYGSNAPLDFAAYAFNFILIDGKMRGLFSFLFGASMLLVIQKAEAKGENPAAVHFRRQLVLLMFGAMHFYLIWFGDILFGYALIGMLAWLFRGKPVKSLVGWGLALIVLQFALMSLMALAVIGLASQVSQPGASKELVSSWNEFTDYVRSPSPDQLRDQLGLILGPWTGVVHSQLSEHRFDPLIFTLMFGAETLGYMLFGMAGLKSGFLTGEWSDRNYRRIAVGGLALAVPAYCLLAFLLFRANFSVTALFSYSMAATVMVRPIMVVALAALIILATRKSGWLIVRIAAAGRAAFTNYLGTSILMTGLFYGWGLGLFGELGRAQLWLVVIAMWAVMLAWSKPWLDRFQYGPLEWLWRTLSRWSWQPMRKQGTQPVEA